jgi:hypothetical protein
MVVDSMKLLPVKLEGNGRISHIEIAKTIEFMALAVKGHSMLWETL